MQPVAEYREGPARAALSAIPPLLLSAAVLALHFTVPRSSFWHEPVLILLAFPVLLAALSGLRSAAPTLALPAVALADDIVDGELTTLALEALLLAALVAIGAIIARGVDVEQAHNDRVLAETQERRTRLKDTWGLWQAVALSRMGAYATSVEESFLDETLRERPAGVIADVGSAGGRLEHVLTRHAEHVVATDIDRDEVYAMADDPKLTPVVVGELPTLPIRDNTIDTVVSIQAPAVSEEGWFREECRRVLRPGGIVLLTLYNARSYKGLLTRLRRRTWRSEESSWQGLYFRHSTAEHLRLWRAAGFRSTRLRGFYWAPLGRRSESRWVVAAAALERLLGLRRLVAVSPVLLVELRREDRAPTT